MTHRARFYAATLAALVSFLFAAPRAQAKTIIITDAACDRMAMIASVAPRMGWASSEAGPALFNLDYINLRAESAFLIRFPLDVIPKDQRITKAELLMPFNYLPTANPRVYVHRILGEWGPGVCWLYRTTKPEKIPWAAPGVGASSTDRATRPTATVRPDKPVETAVNVTEDVELWNSGGARNQGWVITCEDDAVVRLTSPNWSGPNTWKLRITYEPR